MNKLAPIILFVYNRPGHTEQTLEALSLNSEAAESVLFVYADGPKANATPEDIEKIKQTRQIAKKKQWCKEVILVTSEINKGLANSIVSATTEIVNRFGMVITIEDDVIVSKYFLHYMNEALGRFEREEKVLMISGYYWPVKPMLKSNSSYFLAVPTTQAWGTWKRVWDQFDFDASGYEILKDSESMRKKFNLDNNFDFTSMLLMQMELKIIDSWAIRFWWSMFNKKGVILFPDKSLIKNIGWDGSGVHSGKVNLYFDEGWDPDYSVVNFPHKIIPNRKQFKLVKKFHKQLSSGEKITIKNKVLGALIQLKARIIKKKRF